MRNGYQVGRQVETEEEVECWKLKMERFCLVGFFHSPPALLFAACFGGTTQAGLGWQEDLDFPLGRRAGRVCDLNQG